MTGPSTTIWMVAWPEAALLLGNPEIVIDIVPRRCAKSNDPEPCSEKDVEEPLAEEATDSETSRTNLAEPAAFIDETVAASAFAWDGRPAGDERVVDGWLVVHAPAASAATSTSADRLRIRGGTGI